MAPAIGIGLSVCHGVGMGGGGGLAQPYYELGFDGQPLANLATTMSVDATAAVSIAGVLFKGYRPAASIINNDGVLIDYFIGQQDGNASADNRIAAIYLRTSTDNGETFTPLKLIYRRETAGVVDYAQNSKWVNGPLGVVVHRATGRVHMIMCKSDGALHAQLMTPFHWSSADGITWPDYTTDEPTSIYATTVKADNATPAGQPDCYDTGIDADWEWYMITGGLCVENGADAGRIYMFGNHRYDSDQSADPGYTSWSHCIYTDNGDNASPTWVLGGGYDETVAGNDESNEIVGVEFGTSGHILVQNRIQNGTAGSQYFRGQQTLTDLTDTWPDMDLATDGTADIAANPVHGALWKSGDYLYSAFVVGRSVRSQLKVFRSEDDGATWPVSRILCNGYAGYCMGLTLPDGTHRILFERTHNYGSIAFADQYTTQVRFNDTWLEGADDYPIVCEWGFTEAEHHGALSTVGTQLLDAGKNGTRITDQRGFGGANAGYAYDSEHGWCLEFAGSGTGMWLQEVTGDASSENGVWDSGKVATGNMTVEFTIQLPEAGAGSAHCVFDNRNNSGAGMTILFNNGGQLVSGASDGSTSVTTTAGGSDYNDGEWHSFAVVVDRAGNLTCYDTTSGSAVPVGTGVSLAAVTGVIRPQQKGVIGRLSTTNSTHLAAGSLIHRVRVTRKALSTGWMEHLGDKIDHDTIMGYTHPAVPTSATIPNLPDLNTAVLWLGATHDLGYHGRTDFAGAHDHPYYSNERGRGVITYRDLIGHSFFNFVSNARGMFWDTDADVGPHWRHMYASANSNGNYVSCDQAGAAAVNTAFDVVQSTQVFTLFFCIKVLTDATGTLIDNVNNTTTTAGFGLYRAGTSGNMTLRVNDAGSSAYNTAPSATTIAANTWTCYAIVGNTPGGGNRYTTYRATISGGVVGATTAATGGTDIPSTIATPASLSTSIFSRQNTNNGCLDIRSKNTLLFPTRLTQANFEALCAMCATL